MWDSHTVERKPVSDGKHDMKGGSNEPPLIMKQISRTIFNMQKTG